MNLPLYIAWRYFFSRKKINYVHLLSIISQIGIAIGTAALVIVLSVFNGFENLVLEMYNVFDPHIKILSSEGKNFDNRKANEILLKFEEIDVFSSTIEEKVLLEYDSRQHIATIKGVDSLYSSLTNFDSVVVSGNYIDKYENKNVAVVGRGIAYYLSMNINSVFDNLQIYLPNRKANNMLQIENAFSNASLSPVGIFGIQQEIDSEFLISPINFVQNLIQKENYVSAIEINLVDKDKMFDVQKKLSVYPGIKFLSHTVDPLNDTPDRMLQYVNDLKSKNIEINLSNWDFVTGPKEALYNMANSYFVNVSADSLAPGGFLHSEYFVLVDKEGRVRSGVDRNNNVVGVYDGTNDAQMKDLINDVKVLLAEYKRPIKENEK